MEDASRSSQAPARHDERRRSPRIEILGRLHGQVVALNVEVVVREMSLGGMSLEGPFAFPTGAVHEFRLTLGDGSMPLLSARVVYSRNISPPGSTPVYVTGVQFIDDEDKPEIGDILGSVQQ